MLSRRESGLIGPVVRFYGWGRRGKKKAVTVRFGALAIPQLVTRPRVPCTDHCGGF